MDSFVACTDMDEENIILSLYAKEKGILKGCNENQPSGI